MGNWKNQYISLIDTLPELIISLNDNSEISACLNTIQTFSKSFENIICEIGSGSGLHLIERAALDPKNLYIGFELRYKRTFRTAEKAKLRGLNNLIVIRGSAEFIPDIFKEIPIYGVFINFPDPWSKSRWKKHRIVNSEFLSKVGALIKENGFIAYKTDHQEYFYASRKVFGDLMQFLEIEYTEDLHNSPYQPDNVPTEFEQLFRSKGQVIYYLKVQKGPSLDKTPTLRSQRPLRY